MSPRRQRRLAWGVRIGVTLVLALVFMAYQRPGLVVDLANRLWSCF